MIKVGKNSFIDPGATVGEMVTIGNNCTVESGATIGNNVYIDSGTIIRSNAVIGDNTTIGSNCIIAEYLMDFYQDREIHDHKLIIGKNAIIRSGTIIYAGSTIGDYFQTGHRATIREDSKIGDHVSVGTLTDIQGNCEIGNYVRMHSNVHVGQLSKIDDYVWIYPYVVLTNDPTPPSTRFVGVHIHSFAIVATSAVVMPGIEILEDSLVAAGAIVTKNVGQYAVVGGNPARVIGDVRNIKSHFTGENVYPWREHFDRAMPWENLGYVEWSKEK